MLEDQFNTVLDRVYQLEQTNLKRNIQNRARFIIQFFLLLVVILVIGYYFYQHLEVQIQNVDQTQSLYFSKFTDEKISTKIASQIVNQIENNEQVRTAIKKVVEDDFQRRIETTPLTEETTEKTEATPPQTSEQALGYDKPAVETTGASETVPEQVTDDSREKEKTALKPTIDKKAALKFEAQGFTYLLAGEFDKAITAFNKAEISFPSFHQVYEIGRLLRKERDSLDDPEKRRQVYLQIVNDMSFGAPSEMIDKLRKIANEEGIVIKTDS